MKRFCSFSILSGGYSKPISLAVLLTCLFAATAFGQTTTGSISGTVTDPTGAVVAGATVTITNPATGAERSVESNEQGAFNVPALQPGKYTVTVDAKGFKKAVSHDIIVTVTQIASVTIPLEIGSASETVTVSASQEVINTSSPSVTNIINTRQVVDLPLAGRNPVELAGLQAGIAVVGTDVRGASVSGLRQTAVNLTQDGINAMDNFVKTSSFFALTTPSLNSTSEFSITTSTGGADSGRGVAQVNLVTKGGTRQFHGGLYYYNRNEDYNANNFFTDDSHYAMTTTDDPNRKSKVQVLGRSFSIQDNSALVSNAVNVASSTPVLVTGTPGACTCEFMSYGWWQTSITYTGSYRAGQTDTINAAPYIAGTLASSIQMPQTGSATYNGFMVGNAQDAGGPLRNVAGSYSSTWSFQNRIGSFNGAFDGRTHSGAIIATPGSGGVSFAGATVGTGGLIGTLSGSFFSAPGDAAKYQAGAFAIGQNSSVYKASGVFAGQR